MKKEIAIPIGLVSFLVVIIFTAGQMFITTKNTKEKVEKVEFDIEEMEDELTENDKRDLEQTYLIKDISKTQMMQQTTLQNLNRKIEKELAE